MTKTTLDASSAISEGDLANVRVYLDYQATTPIDPRVLSVVTTCMSNVFGNASSADHIYGDEAAELVAVARAHVAALVGATPEQVIFTSGSTESINIALQGLARLCRDRQRRPLSIAVAPIEHAAVLDTIELLKARGDAVTRPLSVNAAGQVSLDDIECACREGVDALCLMGANNEVGTIYPLREASNIARQHGVFLFCDATQSAGRIPPCVEHWHGSALSISAHKMYGPKGVGALIVPTGMRLQALFAGGNQQMGIRPGTLNVPGIVGFGEAARLRIVEMSEDEARTRGLRDDLETALKDKIPGLVVNGDSMSRLAGSLHVSIPGVPNHAVIARIRNRIAISTGAACSSGIERPSHVLQAMGLRKELLDSALRISLGKFTKSTDIDVASAEIPTAVAAARAALYGAVA